MIDGSYYKDQLRRSIAGQRWLVAMEVAAAATGLVRMLHELGAERSFVLAGHAGLGPQPAREHAELVLLDVRGDTMMGQIRAAEAAYVDLSPEVVARIEAWDPEGRARVIGAFFAQGEAICGRPYWGGRPASWRALEDKLLAEGIWDRAGVSRAPAAVVEAQLEAMWKAARALDAGQGTVWSGDMREGFNGGAEYVRWVRSEAQARQVAPFFEGHCDRIRVMPFLDGLPCSIHGMVFPDRVVTFRPCEMVVLRSESARFRYASAATFWEPDPADAAEMRGVAVRVGELLRREVDYRGAFTIDGVLTAEGFRPTELNPRVGAALLRLTAGIPGLSITLLNLALAAGDSLEWEAEALERLVVHGSRLHRSAVASVVVEQRVVEPRAQDLCLVGNRCRPALEGEVPDASAGLGEHPAGGFLKVGLNPERTPAGPSVAPRMAAVMAWADDAWGLGIGPVQSAPDLRPRAES